VLVLALDTSTPTVTAGVVVLSLPHEVAAGSKPIGLLAERMVTDPFAHAEQLIPLAQAALEACGHRLADLDAIVVGIGPGPFTGLRVGIATAQALGDALDVPVHPVPSHDGAARQFVGRGSVLAPFLVVTDARRREVYLSAYAATGSRVLGPVVVAPDAVLELLGENRLQPSDVVGAGSVLLAGVLGARIVGELTADGSGTGSRSAGLVTAAAKSLLTGVIPGPLTPLYLRRPDASVPGAAKSVLPQPESAASR